MSSMRVPVSFQEVALCFTEEEWRHLQDWQRELYKEVMQDNLDSLLLLMMMEELGEAGGMRGGTCIYDSAAGSAIKVEEWSPWDWLQKGNDAGSLGVLDKIYHRCADCQEVLGSWSLLVDHKMSHWRHHPYTSLQPSIPKTQRRLRNQKASSNGGSWSLPDPQGPWQGRAQQENSKALSRPLVKCENSDSPAQAEDHVTKYPFQCSSCAKTFTNLNLLLEHKKLHKKNQGFTCPDCGKSFVRKSVLKLHRRTHTGERPFSCPECGKSFSQRFNLVIHQRIHSGEKPYKCVSCDKSFRYKPALLRHEEKCARSSHRMSSGGKAKAVKPPPPPHAAVQTSAGDAQSPLSSGVKPPPMSPSSVDAKASLSLGRHPSSRASSSSIPIHHSSPSRPTENRHSYSSSSREQSQTAALPSAHSFRKSSAISTPEVTSLPSATFSAYPSPPPSAPTLKKHPPSSSSDRQNSGLSPLVHHQSNMTACSLACPDPSMKPHTTASPALCSLSSRKPRVVSSSSVNLPIRDKSPSKLRDRSQLDGGPSTLHSPSLSQAMTSPAGSQPPASHPLSISYPSATTKPLCKLSSSKSTNLSLSSCMPSPSSAATTLSSDNRANPSSFQSPSEWYGSAKYSPSHPPHVGLQPPSFPSLMCPPSIRSNGRYPASTKPQPSANHPSFPTSGGHRPPMVLSSPSCSPSGYPSPPSERFLPRSQVPTLALSSPPQQSATMTSKREQNTSQGSGGPEMGASGPPTQPAEKWFKCGQCKRAFMHMSQLIEHQKTHTGAQHTCPECNRIFHRKSTLILHRRTHTGEKPYACTECGRSFSQRFNLVIHQRIHTGESPYICKDCNKAFRYRTGLLLHQRHALCPRRRPAEKSPTSLPLASLPRLAKDPARRAATRTSERTFSVSPPTSVLKAPVTTETPELTSSLTFPTTAKFIPKIKENGEECDVFPCTPAMSSSHSPGHRDRDPPYKASTSPQSHYMKVPHVKPEPDPVPVSRPKRKTMDVDQSGRRGDNKPPAARRVHSEKSKFKCDHCKRCFSRADRFAEHQILHATARHVCPECGRAFSKPSQLLLHRRTHTGEKPYCCPKCGRQFSQKFNLIVHQRIHTGEKPFKCPDCGKEFRYRTGLIRHQKYCQCS